VKHLYTHAEQLGVFIGVYGFHDFWSHGERQVSEAHLEELKLEDIL